MRNLAGKSDESIMKMAKNNEYNAQIGAKGLETEIIL